MKQIMMLLVAVLVVPGCSSEESVISADYLVEYQMSMERIEAPAQISVDQPLVVKLHGIVGGNPSYGFDHVDIVESESVFDLTLFGVHNEDPNLSWPQVVVEWHGREFIKQPPHSNPVSVVLHQADGSVLEAEVTVVQ